MRLNPFGNTCRQETPDEFPGGSKIIRFDLVASAIVFPLEPDLIVFDVEQAVIGDGEPRWVIAAHVQFEHFPSARVLRTELWH